jgi:apolipoprotein N-acyltransferase
VKPVVRSSLVSHTWLVLGSALFLFVGWRFNVALAAWLAPLFLIRYFRDRPRWYAALPAVPLLALASYAQLAGGWDLDTWMYPVFSLLRPVALFVGLFADRALHRRLPRWASTLVYPAVSLAVDYAVSFTPLGTTMAVSATQFGLPAIAQLASLTGIWGIGFLAGWTASVANLAWEERGSFTRARRTIAAWACCFAAVLAFGSARAWLTRPGSPTVRVAGVTIEHVRDYWDWIDASTPRVTVAAHAAELAALQDALFERSAAAVAGGAKIIVWSEGNAVVTPEGRDAFASRASAFARDHGVYLAAAVLELSYDSMLSDNKVVMFAPDGSTAFTYVKTMSWYPTGSDGILRTVETPYGTIGAAVCFDMDFPYFVGKLARMKADIVLVPSFDSERIRPFHTEVGLFRAVEGGYSVVRQVSTGTSMAVDAVGRVLARQDHFTTADRLMFADVPTRGTWTLYGALGDWFAWLASALALALFVLACAVRRHLVPGTRGGIGSSDGRGLPPAPV